MKTAVEKVISELNELHFFREFTYFINEFYTPEGQKVELADFIIYLDGLMFIFQIKQRNTVCQPTSESEKKWFNKKILDMATKQVRSTLNYLKELNVIEIKNQNGDIFNLASCPIKKVHKVVLYYSSDHLPEEYKAIKYHESKTADVIHILSATDYINLVKKLITPTEIFEYFLFREELILKWKKQLIEIHESALLGQYFSGKFEDKPNNGFKKSLLLEEQEVAKWDITGVIHNFKKNIITPVDETNHYVIIQELAKMTRDELRIFMERFTLARKDAIEGKTQLTYRMAIPRLDCGFIFIPFLKKDEEHLTNALNNLTIAHKYDQCLSKCIGILFIAEEYNKYFITWNYLEFPWERDEELAKELEIFSPFLRAVKAVGSERYLVKLE